MSTQNSKSILARALAQENITVEHRPNATTAMFDVANRVLVLPVWINMSDELHDMFVGHEVGHALFTPYRRKDQDSRGPWYKDAEEIGGTMNAPYVQALLNVVEDSRIERMMKEKFPGLRRDFVAGYKELNEKDFFGINGKNLATLDFGDRLNLHTKLGVSANVPFSDSERELVDLVERIDSFDDVIDATRKIYEFINGQYEDMPDEPSSGVGENQNNSDGNGEGMSNPSPSNEQNQNNDPADSMTSSNTNDIRSETQQSSSNPARNKMQMVTQENFDKSTNDLVDTSCRNVQYYTLPDPNLDRIILPYKKFLAEMNEHENACTRNGKRHEHFNVFERSYSEILQKTKPLVSTLVKQFEMRKAADVSKRTSVSRSGKINLDNLHKYKVTDDIFLRCANIAEGKNHGLVMFVDWSASMSIITEDVVCQIIMLTNFCRRVGIPFDVYFFTSHTNILNKHLGISPEYATYEDFKQWTGGKLIQNSVDRYDNNAHDRTENSMHPASFALVNVLSSSMSSREFASAQKHFYNLSRLLQSAPYAPRHYDQGNTPLDETILAAMKIVPQFREKHKVQIVNTVFLTDGDSSGHLFSAGYRSKSYVTTPWSKKVYDTTSYQSHLSPTDAMLDIFKDITGTNAIGFFITCRPTRYFYNDADRKKFKEDGFFDVPVNQDVTDYDYMQGKRVSRKAKTHGYSRLFVIQSRNDIVDIDNDLDRIANGASFARIRNTFIKSVNKHNASRAFLNRFADVIAVA